MKVNREKVKKTGYILLLIVTLSCFTTIVVNYYTIKILSATRAYINGESQYSKGQKEASEFLISYLYSENSTDYASFLKAINIPIGDRYARESLSSDVSNYHIAQSGFLQAKNHPDDIGNMIWLFKKFQHLGLFSNAITIWKQADIMVEQLHQTGLTAYRQINSKSIDPAQKKLLILKINNISAQLTGKQQAFSTILGIICRKISFWVFVINVIVTCAIIGSIILFVWITLRNMQDAQNKIIEKNNSLQIVNNELDKIVYNVSHDLRSPLASLTGLISLINREEDIAEIRFYAALMQESVNKQAKFITDILQSAKNKQGAANNPICDVAEVIEDVVTQNNYSYEGKKLRYHRDISITNIDCDALKLKIVLNNLVSNAVKYSDVKKHENWIAIKAYRSELNCVIEVEDNGIGINCTDKDRIFDKFFAARPDQNNTGIGLYLTKDAVEQMNGTINVSSQFGIGSKFTINIPCFTGSN